ncbi:MAG: TldD/PmbA family protein [bacterium]|nr:TldD/PmbA family protein [bacterium]
MEYRELMEDAIVFAKRRGAEYAEVRMEPDSKAESITVEDEKPSQVAHTASQSMGILVYKNGGVGFWGISAINKDKVHEMVKRALESAEANGSFGSIRPILPDPELKGDYYYATPYTKDPFVMPLEEKINLLVKAEAAMREEIGKMAFYRSGNLNFEKTQKLFLNSFGLFTDQRFLFSGAQINVNVRRFSDDDIQGRTFPDGHGYIAQAGYEYVQEHDLVKEARRITREALDLCYAPCMPSAIRNAIILPGSFNLHGGHETIHGFEGDRCCGTEWTLAGGSFFMKILPEIGTFKFGSEHVNIVAESAIDRGVGTFLFDDEGTPRQRTQLVKDGTWVGLLTSRESVTMLNRQIGRPYFTKSGGTMRAMSGKDIPLIRMVNILIEPGHLDLEELKENTPDGTVMFGANKSWTIDDYRRHFQFGVEIAWEKVSGKWELRKNGLYYGDNLAFWRNCLGFCNEKSWELYGLPNCGKGDPMQVMKTGHGTSPAYFKDVYTAAAGR